ncbi:MAG: NnrU family protein [Methylocapsa sp.]|nr:NnrU family protein [Methylocapsa sp.]
MLSLILAAIFFTGIHLGIAGTRVRDRAVELIGQNAFRALFSIASAAGLIWLILAYSHAPYFATWGHPQWWKWFAALLMIPAFVLVVLGLRAPNPAAVGMEGLAGRSPQGIVRVTRHPLLVGTGLWALVHLIANGDAASFFFFGALALTAFAGTVSIDAKRRRLLGPAWESFAAQTSIVPFAAIAAGRISFAPLEIAPRRWAIAFAVYLLFLFAHPYLFGVSPFPG